jgi:hypothetical protein
LRSELSVEPDQGRHDRFVLVTQPLDQLDRECVRKGGVVQTTQDVLGALRGPTTQAQKVIRQLVGLGPRMTGADHLFRQASQVLHQSHAKMDGHGPELADAERLNALVGTDETAERLHLEPAVAMGHIGPREAIDPGAACEVPRCDLRQPAVVAPREVVSDPPELLVDDMKIVEEPLLGEGDLPLRRDRLDAAVVCVEKHAPVVAHRRKKIPPSGGLLRDAISRREALGMLLQALRAEELGADRFLHVKGSSDRALSDAHRVWPFGPLIGA